MTGPTHIALFPRDGLFCKDGRGWHTSTSGRGHALEWPWPSTILGALRTAWGREWEDRNQARFGPDDWRKRTADIRLGKSLVLRRLHGSQWDGKHRTWPVPADALWLGDRPDVYRLDPMPPTVSTLGRDDDDAREQLWRPMLQSMEKPLVPPRWWSDENFLTWLSGGKVSSREREHPLALSRRIQAHVGIRPEELTADEGVLFSHDVVETLERSAEWAIGVEVDFPNGGLPRVTTVGSDGRLARIEELPKTLFDLPDPIATAFTKTSAGLRVAVVTPVSFQKGWLPDGLEQTNGEYRGTVPGLTDKEVVLRGAFVPRPLHVSGWDMAAGAPKRTSRMVPAGAVYFFERVDGKSFDEADARSVWLTALGARTSEGFGRVVPGIWNPKRNNR